MKFQLFSIFDLKSKVFLAPFVARTEVDARRQIASSMRDPQMRETPVGQHPEDFALYHLGDFDDEAGFVSGLNIPSLVATVSALIEAPGTVPS